MSTVKEKIGLILNDDTPESSLKKKINFLILFLIVLSSLQVILESIATLDTKYHYQFFMIDGIVSVIFSLEYILRLWSYRPSGNQPTFKERISYFFSFYMLIDLVSILPFFISIFISNGFGFLKIIRILRLFRLLKFARYMKSQNLVVNAIKNKGKELILSMQVVAFLTVILSAILYHIETVVQPENFGDIVDAFIWSLSKFIGGVGGYGDFEPITLWGQVMATVVGLLGIALFAVPAGIIGAGFVEEIEAIKSDEDLVEKNNLLLSGFDFENMAVAKRAKKKVGLEHIRRRKFKLSDAELRLMLSRENVIRIAADGHGINLRNVKLDGEIYEMIEGFHENRNYGTCTNRNVNYTVISNLSAAQPFLGHFTYAISEYLESNYISSEKVSGSQFIPKYKVNLSKSELYMKDEEIENEYLKQFKRDLLETVDENGTVIYFKCSGSINGSVHILNGGEKGEDKFLEQNGTFNDLKKLNEFYDSLKSDLEEFDQTEDKIYSDIHKHKFYGNDNREEFQWMLRKKKKANVILVYVSPNFLKAHPRDYYPIIEIIGKNLKTLISN
ncbi:ion transporter [Crocinitomicaceae bacterium]|nr:ion transporter [Crocinitomicaceae bacterium]